MIIIHYLTLSPVPYILYPKSLMRFFSTVAKAASFNRLNPKQDGNTVKGAGLD